MCVVVLGVFGDDVSGRWIRDQLRDVDDDASDNSSVSALEQATAEALGDSPEVEELVAEVSIPEARGKPWPGGSFGRNLRARRSAAAPGSATAPGP